MSALETSDGQDRARQQVRANATLFHLSFPLFLQSLVALAVMLFDTMIISAHSAGAAAAVSIANQILMVAFEVSTLLGIGGVILISRALGAGDEAQARGIAAVAVVANTVLGLGLGIVLAVAGPLVLSLMETTEAIARDARLYIHIVSGALISICFSAAAVACLRGFGHSRIILVLGVFGSVFYLSLEYVFILGLGPIPALGATGSALGTLVMRTVVAIVLVCVLTKVLRLRLRSVRLSSQWPLVRRLFGLSFPSVSDYIAYGVYQLILVGFIAAFGVTDVVSRAYVMIAVSFLTLVIMAISQGNEVLLGYHQGAGRTRQAHDQAVRSTVIAATAATSLAALLYLLSDRFTGLFTQHADVLDLSKRLLWLTIFLQPGFATNIILFHSLRAVGDVRIPVLVSQALTWGLSLPLAWLFCVHYGHGVVGIWYALIIEETIKAILMSLRWTQLNRQQTVPQLDAVHGAREPERF
ncbi:MATE family efflux transporter [Agrobacterium cavarae]|uniref:MATE family efflux transporter n=1 Tax=Agrobacterium cavarae TaxID=2528239 RepID=UPI003EE7AED4